MNPKYRFESENHTHHIGDLRVPGTSELFKSLGLIDDTWFNESARIRGIAVHAACQFLAEGDLDWKTVDPVIVDYVRAYEKLIKDTGFVAKECEKHVWSDLYNVATIIDQVGTIKQEEGIIELKTGKIQPYHSIQTAIQAMLRWPDGYLTKFRTVAELHSDGTYRLGWFTDTNDFDVARAMIAVYWHKRKNKIKE